MIVPTGVDYMQKEHDLAAANPSWFSLNQYVVVALSFESHFGSK
jgi:hypothetical protein